MTRLLRIIGMLVCIGLYWTAGHLCSLAIWIEKREG